MSEYVLDIMQPYPGDSNAIGDNGIQQRFIVYRTTNPDWYRIMDHLPANSCMIPTSKLENPYFRLGEWYSRRLSCRLKKLRKLNRKWTMGDAYCINAMYVLCSGIPMLYPSSDPDLDPEARFHVTRGEPDEFIIYDEEFVQPMRIDKSIITNTHFDLAKWYQVRHYPRLPFDGENVDLDLSSLEFLNGGYEPTSDQVGDTGSDNNDDDAPDLQSVSDSDWNEHRGSTSNLSGASTDSDWDECTYNAMGDVLGEAVARILESLEPYPGDTNFSQHLHDQFEVVHVGDDQYQVHDRHQQMFCYLPVHMVRQPDFAPGQWYATRQSVHTGISSLRWRNHIPQLTMGNVLEQEITCTLRRGAPYSFNDEFPAISLACRFFVVFSPMDDNTFVILDRQWEIITFLPRVMAENPAFDLATWYKDQLINELEKYRHKMKSYAYPVPDKNS